MVGYLAEQPRIQTFDLSEVEGKFSKIEIILKYVLEIHGTKTSPQSLNNIAEIC